MFGERRSILEKYTYSIAMKSKCYHCVYGFDESSFFDALCKAKVDTFCDIRRPAASAVQLMRLPTVCDCKRVYQNSASDISTEKTSVQRKPSEINKQQQIKQAKPPNANAQY